MNKRRRWKAKFRRLELKAIEATFYVGDQQSFDRAMALSRPITAKQSKNTERWIIATVRAIKKQETRQR